jgi:hypothetical protein
MATVTLGNVSHTALMSDPDTGVRTRYASTNITQSTTILQTPEDGLYNQMRDVINLWHHESDQPPAWIEGDDPDLVSALRKHFGTGEQPQDWENDITGPPASVVIDERAAGTVLGGLKAEAEADIAAEAAIDTGGTS